MTPRRQSDHPAWTWLGWFGALIAVAAVALKWFGRLDGADFWALLVFAALMIRPDKLVDLARARWGNGKRSSGAFPRNPDDGSEPTP